MSAFRTGAGVARCRFTGMEPVSGTQLRPHPEPPSIGWDLWARRLGVVAIALGLTACGDVSFGGTDGESSFLREGEVVTASHHDTPVLAEEEEPRNDIEEASQPLTNEPEPQPEIDVLPGALPSVDAGLPEPGPSAPPPTAPQPPAAVDAPEPMAESSGSVTISLDDSFDSGLPLDTQLSELTNDEALALCYAVDKDGPQGWMHDCNVESAQLATFISEEDYRDECTRQQVMCWQVESIAAEPLDCDGGLLVYDPACPGTVADYEQCMNDYMAEDLPWSFGYSCRLSLDDARSFYNRVESSSYSSDVSSEACDLVFCNGVPQD